MFVVGSSLGNIKITAHTESKKEHESMVEKGVFNIHKFYSAFAFAFRHIFFSSFSDFESFISNWQKCSVHTMHIKIQFIFGSCG